MSLLPPIHVVGGVYFEYCLRPTWSEVYGSAGRAASAIAMMGGKAQLHAYLDESAEATIRVRSVLEDFVVHPTPIERSASFSYIHGLATPDIFVPRTNLEPIEISEDSVVRFGQIEGDAIVHCKRAVYDPQTVRNPQHFHENGSSCDELALILNQQEAQALSGKRVDNPEELAKHVSEAASADIVVIKRGASGATVFHAGDIAHIPAFATESVWTIGSGDTFVGHFAFRWLTEQREPAECAELASRATAYYCQTKGLPNRKSLNRFVCNAIQPTRCLLKDEQPMAYLAGPFFNLPQLWMVEQARKCLFDMGFKVFSPYHDVGLGSAADVAREDLLGLEKCDVVFALLDGLDSGTVFEIGHARCKSIPVIAYAETINAEDQKMMIGTDCELYDDFVTSIYKAHWKAIS